MNKTKKFGLGTLITALVMSLGFANAYANQKNKNKRSTEKVRKALGNLKPEEAKKVREREIQKISEVAGVSTAKAEEILKSFEEATRDHVKFNKPEDAKEKHTGEEAVEMARFARMALMNKDIKEGTRKLGDEILALNAEISYLLSAGGRSPEMFLDAYKLVDQIGGMTGKLGVTAEGEGATFKRGMKAPEAEELKQFLLYAKEIAKRWEHEKKSSRSRDELWEEAVKMYAEKKNFLEDKGAFEEFQKVSRNCLF